MLPPFDENGYLPPGVHSATLAEVEHRYAYTQRRKWLFLGLKKLSRALRTAGCATLYLNGCFITSKPEPADYDAVWEYEGVDNTIDPILRDGTTEQIRRRYAGDVFCRMLEIHGKDHVAFFQEDRHGIPKGVIKIDLREPYDQE